MVTFRDLQTPQQALDWTAQLNDKWPERIAVIDHIISLLQKLPFSDIHIVELCPGVGTLALALLSAIPDLTYTGLDSSSVMVETATKQLQLYRPKAQVVETDLNQDAWLDVLPNQVQAIVSMQSLHDLGGEKEVDRIYRLAKTKLAPKGLFLNADLIVPEGIERANNPGRRSVSRHLNLIQMHHYEQVSCTLQTGEFACIVGYA
ncbi:MAG: class I SAM-dependent methyltransferase [Chloroflexota bacterium]